jgi:diguanylate cyclase (GGDEF)-like protein
MDRGAADYVCKPFSIDDLLARVDASVAPPPATAVPATDPAAGLPNREHLATVLDRQAVAARRTGRPFAVILADLDAVDGIVAAHGDAVADDVVRAVAKRFRQHGDVSDVIVRFDDHALALVLPGADAEAAAARAEQLRAALGAAPLDTPTAAVFATACFGVAAHEPIDHADETLLRAIDALCVAMAGGTDTVRSG